MATSHVQCVPLSAASLHSYASKGCKGHHNSCQQVAKDVPAAMFGSTELRELSRKMIHIMRAAPGVGLAAPQIAVGLKVVDDCTCMSRMELWW